MINLIRNEVYKLIHKKSTFVILIIMFAFVVLTNFIYKRISINEFMESHSYEYDYDEAVRFTTNNQPDDTNIDEYAYYASVIDIYNLKNKYSEKWMKSVMFSDLQETYRAYHVYEYLQSKDELNNTKKEIDEMINNLDSGNWKFFVDRKLNDLKEQLAVIKSGVGAPVQNRENYIKQQSEIINKQIELLEYRLINDLPIEGGTYLDDAIRNIEGTIYEVADYKYSNKDKYEYQQVLEIYNVNEYVLKNKVDANNTSTLRYILIEFYSEYYFLILLFMIIVAGAIVSDEFNKGTIKSLLILPYSRTKILLAKYITTILALIFGILAVFIMQFIIGGLFFGFGSISIPFITYNIATENIVIMNVIKYFFIVTLTMLPKLILLGTLAFALSTVFANTAVAIAVTFCGYIGETIVNALALHYKVKFLNYFVTTNWSFNELLFGGKSTFNLSLTQNIIVCLVYLFIMLLVSFIVFRKKDIKNI